LSTGAITTNFATIVASRSSSRVTRGLDHIYSCKHKIILGRGLGFSERLAEERELFSRLSVEQLEQLAAESEALVSRARAMLQAQRVPPVETALPGARVSSGENIQPGQKPRGTDVDDA
jgi:hypothetical protein